MRRLETGHDCSMRSETVAAAHHRLAAKRAELEEQLAEVRASADRSTASATGIGFGKRVGDTTSVAVERLTEVAAHAGLLGTLRQLEHAEHLLAEGRYGECEVCGSTIPDERLEARPFATRCVHCA